MKKATLTGPLIVFLLAACTSHSPRTEQASNKGPEATSHASLRAVLDAYADAAKRLDAFDAPYMNIEEDLDKFGDFPSPEYYARAKNLLTTSLEKASHVDPKPLSESDQRLLSMFKEDLRVSLAAFDFPDELLKFNQMQNRLHSYLDDSSPELTSFPFDTVAHYEKFAKRSEGFPAYVDRQIELLRRGLREKIVLSCEVANVVPGSYSDGLEPRVEKNPFWRPIKAMPKSFSAKDRARLEASYREMIRSRIVPGFRKFDAFFQKEYGPNCRNSYGLKDLPNGKAWYASAIATNTDQDDWNAERLHQMGLEEVARVTADLEQIKGELGFKGTTAQFLRSVTRDKRYFFRSRAALFKQLNAVRAATEEKIPRWFSLQPKTPYKIVASSNPEDAAGSYQEPSENMPIGRFMVNAINLHAIPTYEVTTLSLHESSPGHHFQQALQYEMKDRLTEYQRKIFQSNAFVEGWAFYTEWLGNEMGLFKDPLQRLGNRGDEMLRAVRLVVDTGIHEFGWTHDQAIAYMSARLPMDAKDIEVEANRYSVWPGQALGYEVGRMYILMLRREAEKALGDRFDVREFHRVVLENGTVSLRALGEHVRAWIARESAKPGAAAGA